ncbi:MmgE/PrpD family protein [Chelatococcus sp.]|uniref:MmgE/PrpD family protein n=1 Tax=Chelatococcus sp. TaxID=1953771 RepID=UPI0025C4BFE1|nr:MmgE/PrpD family protein [Chelatococcus sp.]
MGGLTEGSTGRLARFVLETDWGMIPETVRHTGVRCLVNIVGNALGGVQDLAIQRLISTLRPVSGPPQVAIIGRREFFDPPSAAFINAASSNVLDFDDTHFPSVIHPSAPVYAPLFALLQHDAVSGQKFLTSFILGMEIACRLGCAVSPQHYHRGAHITATCGVVGAAIACGKMRELNMERLVWAMGISATCAGGLVENLGSTAKSVGVGGAARDGLMAALFAEAGIDSSPIAIEGPRGFLAVGADKPDPAMLTRDLGEDWEIERNALKAYPSGVVLGPVIDAALELAGKVDLAQVAKIVVTGNPLLLERADRAQVETGREAKLSIQHSVASALLGRAIGIGDYTDEAVARLDVRRLRSKVSARPSADFALDAARLDVEMLDGTTVSATVDHARGSLTRPISDDELSEKFLSLARWGSSQVKNDRLLHTLWSVDKLADMRAITRLCTAA